MTNNANAHQYSLFTLRACKIRKPPYPDWKERRNLPSIKWPEDGSIGANLWVYSDESAIEGADGYLWWPTTIGFIRGDGVDLKFEKVPTPIDQPPLPIDVEKAFSYFQAARDSIDKGLELLRKL